MPPERAPKDGTFAGFAASRLPPRQALPRSACPRRHGSMWCRRAIPQTEGLQRRHRLRRHPQDHEIRAFGEPVRAAGQRNEGGIHLRLPSCRQNSRQHPGRSGHFTPTPACYCQAIGDIPIGRKPSELPEQRFRRSLPFIQPTPDCGARIARLASMHGALSCIVLLEFLRPSSSCSARRFHPPPRRTRR